MAMAVSSWTRNRLGTFLVSTIYRVRGRGLTSGIREGARLVHFSMSLKKSSKKSEMNGRCSART